MHIDNVDENKNSHTQKIMLAVLDRVDWKGQMKAGGPMRGYVWAEDGRGRDKIWQTYTALQRLTQSHLLTGWLRRQRTQSCSRQAPEHWQEQHMEVPFNKMQNAFKLRNVWNFQLKLEENKQTSQRCILMVTSFSDFHRIFSLVYEILENFSYEIKLPKEQGESLCHYSETTV